ncbi:MAG: hypothetical protein ABW321_19450 [Polyangiales bacterium]
MNPPAAVRCAVVALCLCTASGVKAQAAAPPASQPSPVVAGGMWTFLQLIPSPLLVVGERHVGFGLRWQVTPFLYSFGIAGRPVRLFLVSPIARHSGSLELHASPEWACCTPDDRSNWLLRAGLRVYLPLIEHGEVLSWSIGSSYHYAGREHGAALDVGLYTFFGVLGVNLAVSPWLSRREVTLALSIRYF